MGIGITPGLFGLLMGTAAGTLLCAKFWRTKPWDIHDENSYSEPARLSVGVLAPSIIFFLTLVTMMLGLGAIDRDIDIRFGLAGDALGLANLAFTLFYLFRGLT
jgi:hypothetical protein